MFGINPVGKAGDFLQRLMPDIAGNMLERFGWHDKGVRPLQRNIAEPITVPFQPVNLIMVKSVLMMNQRRQFHAARKQGMRHDPVHRTEIVTEHKVKFLHIAGQTAIAAHAGHSGEQRRCVFGKADLHAPINTVRRAKGIANSRQNRMFGLIAKMVHQTRCARFLIT